MPVDGTLPRLWQAEWKWAYYRAMKDWTEDEINILKQHYETTPMPELMALLPERTIYSMRGYARDHLNLSRLKRDYRLGVGLSETHSDIEFEKEQGIPKKVSLTNWEQLSARR